ncbi:unnamed protein product [Orchesella dallaii]|uniref:Reverse transcriptase domain-containing protein n=1 Tax=Orchesella dallaii TaxID=48710 RepID=A0ABP1Q4E0_9HEXA
MKAIAHVKKCKDTEANIPKYVFKRFANLLVIPLKILYLNIFLTGIVPQNFKMAYCTPLYKGKGRTTQASSYRAIFNFPIIVKVFEVILHNKIVEYVRDVLDDHQHGFRSKRSCETATTIFTQNIYEELDKTSGKAMAVFIDFSKAFDSVNQTLLIRKLINNFDNKIPPVIIRLLINYFTNRKFQIRNGNCRSKEYSIKAGVPAGSILGPLCYALFVNDIGSAILLHYLLYADDLVIWTGCTTFLEGAQKLNNCLIEVQAWCEKNGLKINVQKTKCMRFYKAKDHRAKKAIVGKVLLNKEEVELVDKFTYLGLDIDSTLSFDKHERKVEMKLVGALSKMYCIKRLLPEKIMKTFLSAYVVSVVDYLINIWAVNPQKLVLIQKKINMFLVAYYLPNISKKIVRCQLSKIDVTKYLNRIDLLTAAERRILSLLKFVFKKRHLKLFQGYFVSTNKERGSISRLNVPRHSKELYKQSVKWNGVHIWNHYSKHFVSCIDITYNDFVEICKSSILKERDKLYV